MPVTLTLSTDAMSVKARGADAQRQALQALVDRGLVAQMVVQSLVTGQAMIDLSIRADKAKPVAQAPEGPLHIPQVGGAFDQLMDQVAGANLKDTVEDFRSTMISIRALADDARSTVVQVQKDVGHVAGQALQSTQRAADDFHVAAVEAQRTLVSVRSFADQSQTMVAQASPEITQAVRALNKAAGEMQTSMSAVSSWVGPGSPTRVSLDSALQDFARSARSFTSLVEDIDEQPNALIFGRSHDR